MKTTKIFSILCLLLLLNSCVTTIINTSNKQNYSALKENKMYIINTKSISTIRRFKFINETNESITGIYQKRELQINKNEIVKINKFSIGKTAAIVMPPIVIVAALTFLNSSSNWEYKR
jgi:PBP1b-binding outer membrane lipoprotein LpoB